MQANDRLYIFKCGHVEWNPGFGHGKVRRCLKCRSSLRFIIKKCQDCRKWILLKPAQGKQKRCKDCAVEKNREIQRNRKRDYRKRNKSHRRQTIKLYKQDVHTSHTKIGKYLGISRERVRQIEAEAIAKFRAEWLKRHPGLPNPLEVIHETCRRRHDLNAA
jgi:hypothetical protein